MLDLRLDQIGKTFPPSRQVLDRVTLSVPAGRCLAMLGPSGCGKTTLLRIIAGLEPASSGRIHIGGRDVSDLPSHHRDVAMLFQRPALVPHQTVRDNLRWAWRLREPWAFLRRRQDIREQDLVRISRMLELESDLDRRVDALSGGQQQRVALGRCLLRKAPVCLFDEPLGHLDAPLRLDLRRQIRVLTREAGMTLIHVTHDPEEAFALGDQVAVMQEGRIAQIDDPEALLRMPRNRYVAELACQLRGGLNVVDGLVMFEAGAAYFDNPFGRSRIPGRCVPELLASSKRENSYHDSDKVPMIIGIAARDVSCRDGGAAGAEAIRFTAPLLQQERSSQGAWLIAGDHRGRWVGLSEGLWQGTEATMTIHLERAYWFDAATGQTVCAPSG